MPKFTFTLDDYGSTPVTLEANSQEEAVEMLNAASPDEIKAAARASLEAGASKTGLSPEDINAIMSQGKVGHKAEVSGSTDKFLIGAGRAFDRKVRGVRQILAPVTGEDEQELAKAEQNAREIYNQLDLEGVGMEDIGEALPEMLIMAAGGAVAGITKAAGASLGAAKGLQAVMAAGGGVVGTTGAGALSGATDAALSDEERYINAGIGAAAGTLAPVLSGGLRTVGGGILATTKVLKGITGTDKGKINAAIGLAALAKRQFLSAGFAVGRGIGITNKVVRATDDALMRAQDPARLATTRATNEVAKTAQAVYRRMLEFSPRSEQSKAALQVAKDAFDESIEEVSGSLRFNPAKASKALQQFTDKDLRKLGTFGKKLKNFRDFADGMVGMDDLDPAMVKRAFAGLEDMTDAEYLNVTRALNRALDTPAKMAALEEPLKRGFALELAVAANKIGTRGATVSATQQTLGSGGL